MKLLRRISDDFINDIIKKDGHLYFINEFQKKYRNKIPVMLLEIRQNYICIYFLGQRALKIKEIKKNEYSFVINSEFIKEITDFKNITKDCPKNKDITLSMNDLEKIKGKNFEKILDKIIYFKKGKLAEGVIQDLYSRDNRAFLSNLIILDNYVWTKKGIIDMIGAYYNKNKYDLSVIELKTGNDNRIKNVINEQLIPYIDDVYENKDKYINTCNEIYKQKRKLSLIESKKDFKINFPEKKGDIFGILILDGYNIRSDETEKGLLRQLEKNIKDIDFNDYKISILLKTYVINLESKDTIIKIDNKNKYKIVEKLIHSNKLR